MKTIIKNISIALALLLTLPVGVQPADITPEQTTGEEEREMLTLLPPDGSTIKVSQELAMYSRTIKDALDYFSEEGAAAGTPLTDEHCTGKFLKELFGNGGYVKRFVAGNLSIDNLPNELESLISALQALEFLYIVVIDENGQERAIIDIFMQKFATCLNPHMLEDAQQIEAVDELPPELQAPIARILLESDLGRRALGSALCKTIQHGTSITSVAFSHYGPYLATASYDYTARVYDLERRQRVLRVQHGGWVNSIAFSHDGRYIATASDDNTARVYDLKRPDQPVLRVQHGGIVRSVAFSPDGRYIATASDDNTALVYDLEKHDQPVLRVQHRGIVRSVAFSPDGKYIATASNDNTARVYNLKRPNKPVLTVLHDRSVTSVVFSPDGTYIATASNDRTALVYDLQKTDKPLLTVQHKDWVNSVAFSHDGRYIATSSSDNTASVYNLKRPNKPVLTVLHDRSVTSVVFSPDGTYIATASNDKTALVYDLKRPDKPFLTLQHGDSVKSVAFAPDGTYIATASSDRTAQIHLLPPNSAFRYLTIRQALFILLAQQKSDAHQTIVPSEQIQQIWSLFNPEAKHFLMVKFGRSSLRSMLARITAATRIQALARGHITRKWYCHLLETLRLEQFVKNFETN